MDSLPKHFDVYVQLVLRETFAKKVSINLFYYFKDFEEKTLQNHNKKMY